MGGRQRCATLRGARPPLDQAFRPGVIWCSFYAAPVPGGRPIDVRRAEGTAMIAPAATPAGATSRGRVNDLLRGIGASSPHSVRRAASGQDQPLTVAVDNLD